MKKALLMAVFAVIAMGTIQGATITVTQPGGGEVTMTCPVQIAWTASNVTSNVKILLRKPGGALIGTIANNLPVSPGLYSWVVAAPAVVGESYKIHVRATDGSTEGASAVFTVKDPVAPPPPPPPPSSTLTIVSPNGGESWGRGTEHAISWTSTNLTGKVYLQLVRYNDRTLGTIKDNLPAAGSITWKAGEYPGNTAPVGKYVIRVRSMVDFKIFDESDAPFNLNLKFTQLKKTVALKVPISKKPQITNWGNGITFPSTVSPPTPLSVFFSRPVCEHGNNDLALVGAEWFQYSNVRAARLQRSKLVFPLHDLLGKGADLKQAILKLKRVSYVCNGAFRVASCVHNIEVLQGPWANFSSAPGHWIGGTTGGSGEEFSKDVTETVRKWLDGSEDYGYGFLLVGDELPTSKNFACFSCFEPTLLLTMK